MRSIVVQNRNLSTQCNKDTHRIKGVLRRGESGCWQDWRVLTHLFIKPEFKPVSQHLLSDPTHTVCVCVCDKERHADYCLCCCSSVLYRHAFWSFFLSILWSPVLHACLLTKPFIEIHKFFLILLNENSEAEKFDWWVTFSTECDFSNSFFFAFSNTVYIRVQSAFCREPIVFLRQQHNRLFECFKHRKM